MTTWPMICSFGRPMVWNLTIVDAQVAKFDGVEEGEADRSILVDGFELCALALSFLLALLKRLGKSCGGCRASTPSQCKIFPDSSRTGCARPTTSGLANC